MKSKISFVFTIVFSVCLLFQIAVFCYDSYLLRSRFEESDIHLDYLNAVPMEEMDFFQYVRYLNHPVAGIEYDAAFAAPFSIHYYEEKNGQKIPAYNIPAGTVLESALRSGGYPLGYGFESFPTYSKEWRWVRPFAENQNADLDTLPWYYMKTSDLNDLVIHMLRNSSHWQDLMQRAGLSESQAVSTIMKKCDNMLYETGSYISPNLYPVFWTWPNILLALGLLISLLFLVLHKIREYYQHHT